MDYIRLSKEISYVLRHHPEKYNLSMDNLGFVDINSLLAGLNNTSKFNQVITRSDLVDMIKSLDKERFEIKDERVRALYGHTIPLLIKKVEIIPPDILYHGTTESAYQKIKIEGIKRMRRQYVHLAKEINVAISIGKRRTAEPIVLRIDAAKAYSEGVRFYDGGDDIYLVDYVDPKYISILICL